MRPASTIQSWPDGEWSENAINTRRNMSSKDTLSCCLARNTMRPSCSSGGNSRTLAKSRSSETRMRCSIRHRSATISSPAPDRRSSSIVSASKPDSRRSSANSTGRFSSILNFKRPIPTRAIQTSIPAPRRRHSEARPRDPPH